METEYERFFCISEHSIKQWIKVCDIILNWYSTAGVEAYFAKKYNLFVRPIEFDPKIEIEIFQDFCVTNSYEELRNYVAEPQRIQSYYQYVSVDDKIKESYLNDGTYAYSKICDIIEKMLNDEDFNMNMNNYSTWNRYYCCFKNLVILIIFFLWKSNSITRRIIELSPKLKNISEYREFVKIEKMTSNEISEINMRLLKILNDLG